MASQSNLIHTRSGIDQREQLLALVAVLNHEVLVQPKQVAAVVSDNDGAVTPDW